MFLPKHQNLLKRMNWKAFYNALLKDKLLDNPVANKAYVYARGYKDFQFFMETFFPEYCQLPFSRMHQDFFRSEAEPERRERREAIAAPRSHAKTTVKMLAKAVHAIVYGYEPFILVIGYNQQQAEEKVLEIQAKLQDSKLEKIFGVQLPKSGKGRGGRKGFETTTQIRVKVISRGQEVRGIRHGANRPTLIILDDVENLEECQNPDIRAKVRDWFYKTVMKLGQIDGSTNIIFIGTCLHTESLLSELLVKPGWQGHKYKAIEVFSPRNDLWDQWKTIFNDLSNPSRAEDAEAFFEARQADMLAGTQVLWPEGDSYYKLMKQLVSEGQAAFYSEKQNEPYDPDRQLFHMEQAKRFELEYVGHHPKAIHWLDGSGKVIPWTEIHSLIAFHDPSLGEKPGGKGGSDYAAIVVVGKDTHGYLYVFDCFLEKATPSKQIEAALALHDQWNLDLLYVETNNFQSLLKAQYDQAQSGREGNALLRVSGVHQHANKIERISTTLEPVITYGHLLFSKTLPQRLIEQLTLFPTGYDDGPEALQGAVAQLRKKNYNEIPKSWVNMAVEAPEFFEMEPVEPQSQLDQIRQACESDSEAEPPQRRGSAIEYPAPVVVPNEGWGNRTFPGGF